MYLDNMYYKLDSRREESGWLDVGIVRHIPTQTGYQS